MKTINAVDDQIRRTIQSAASDSASTRESAPVAVLPVAQNYNDPAPAMIPEMDSEAGIISMKTKRIEEPKELRHGLDLLLFIADVIVVALCALKYMR